MFAKGVVFVEGPSDKIVFERLDRYSGSSLEGNEWAIVDMGTKNNFPLFAALARALGVPFTAVVDRDALMRRDHAISLGNKRTQTSSALAALHHATMISGDELEKFGGLESMVGNEGVKSYAPGQFEELTKIVRAKGIFVLQVDLEGTLQPKETGKQGKPLHALDAILERIAAEDIPLELKEAISFLHDASQESAQ